ncbi:MULTISPECIES: TetR/AcrR family transcriptional regulator [Microbacterium]|uniref:TetR/AcrR family transcriptional regulator n=1 Tax=Microbacterium TaxID=33882 RepID=UPI0027831A98|nr:MULTISPECIES: TetR/AcrR family transcriptional regulator [Microbacterium]MDQ1085297.1 AcrR family transcriptional regulator [Microbacterium sp. SORGH_AS_0344]MDQ1169396.1 AcrR family transcriptional regulator [Microbacterium proteolyticum]
MATRATVNGVAEPKQQRSRDSFAKVRSAVLQLLQERGTGQFSLAEVSATAGLSIGSIYGRVSSKAELLRAVQSEEFDRLDAETELRVGGAAAGHPTFDAATAAIVGAYAEILRENREVLSPFFVLGVEDVVILDRGRRSGHAGQAVFVRALLAAAAEHRVPLTAARADWAFEIFYSLTVRHLGLGVAATAGLDSAYDGGELVERLADTVHLVLCAPERTPSRARAKG